jgi:hypothetical protein
MMSLWLLYRACSGGVMLSGHAAAILQLLLCSTLHVPTVCAH